MRNIKTFLGDMRECVDMRVALTSTALCTWALAFMCGPLAALPEQLTSHPLLSICLAALPLCSLSLCGLLAQKNARMTARPLLGRASCVALGIGTLLVALAAGQTLPLIAGMALAWFFLPVCMVALSGGYARVPLRRRIATTAATSMFSALLLILLLFLAPPSGLMLCLFLPLAAAVVITPISPSEKPQKPEANPSEGRPLRYDPSFALTIAAYGFLASLIGWGSFAAVLSGSTMAIVLTALTYVTTLVAITIYKMRKGFFEDSNSAYKPAPLLFAAGFFLLLFLKPPFESLGYALIFTGFGVFFVYCWIVIGNHIQKFNWNYAAGASRALLTLFAGVALGCASARLLSLLPLDPRTTTSALGLLTLVVLLWLMAKGDYFANEPGQDASVFKIGRPPAEQSRTDEPSFDLFVSSYGISKRELDVVRLLAKGRNVPFICDELFIAKSTVQTHIKHIYAKVGASNRQELLDAIERANEGDERLSMHASNTGGAHDID